MLVILIAFLVLCLWGGTSLLSRGDMLGAAVIAIGGSTVGSLLIAWALLASAGSRGRITVDPAARTVLFERLPVSRGFLPHRPVDQLKCTFDHIHAVRLTRSNLGPAWLNIYTAHGLVVVSSGSVDFVELEHRLKEIIAERGFGGEGPVSLTAKAWFPAIAAAIVTLAALAVCLAAGWLP